MWRLLLFVFLIIADVLYLTERPLITLWEMADKEAEVL